MSRAPGTFSIRSSWSPLVHLADSLSAAPRKAQSPETVWIRSSQQQPDTSTSPLTDSISATPHWISGHSMSPLVVCRHRLAASSPFSSSTSPLLVFTRMVFHARWGR